MKSLQSKIDVLSKKTVANGATPSEEAAAKEMIARLLGRTQSSVAEQGVSRKTLEEEVRLFKELASQDALATRYADVDWDVLARHFLHEDHFDYLHETHPAWEQRNRYLKRLPVSNPTYVTIEQYRKKCYDTFMKYWKDNNYVDHRKTENRISPSS